MKGNTPICYCLLFYIVSISLNGCHSQGESNEGFVLQSMSSFQRFTQKAWFAGTMGNWPLADFYHHELEEVTEELVENPTIHEGQDLSKLTADILEPALERLETAIDEADSTLFVSAFNGVTNACNSCHQVTDHGFIKITTPAVNPFNQEFKPD